MAREVPSSIQEQTQLTGALSAIQDDPDAPDLNWLSASGNNVDTVVRVRFNNPGVPLSGAQEFRALVRRFSATQTGVPQGRIELWKNGVLVRAGANTNIANITGTVLSFAWDASEVADADNIECRVYCTRSGGSPGVRNTGEPGAIEWNSGLQIPVESPVAAAHPRFRNDTLAPVVCSFCVNPTHYDTVDHKLLPDHVTKSHAIEPGGILLIDTAALNARIITDHALAAGLTQI